MKVMILTCLGVKQVVPVIVGILMWWKRAGEFNKKENGWRLWIFIINFGFLMLVFAVDMVHKFMNQNQMLQMI